MERNTVGKLFSDLPQKDIHGDHSAGEQITGAIVQLRNQSF